MLGPRFTDLNYNMELRLVNDNLFIVDLTWRISPSAACLKVAILKTWDDSVLKTLPLASVFELRAVNQKLDNGLPFLEMKCN